MKRKDILNFPNRLWIIYVIAKLDNVVDDYIRCELKLVSVTNYSQRRKNQFKPLN